MKYCKFWRLIQNQFVIPFFYNLGSQLIALDSIQLILIDWPMKSCGRVSHEIKRPDWDHWLWHNIDTSCQPAARHRRAHCQAYYWVQWTERVIYTAAMLRCLCIAYTLQSLQMGNITIGSITWDSLWSFLWNYFTQRMNHSPTSSINLQYNNEKNAK